IDTEALAHPRRPVCKACLDWSERRHHLAGTPGAAVMDRFTELKRAGGDPRRLLAGTRGAPVMTRFTELNWAARDPTPGSRVVNFTRTGEKRFAALFGNGQA